MRNESFQLRIALAYFIIYNTGKAEKGLSGFKRIIWPVFEEGSRFAK